jgi:hypothetical protein
MIRPTHHAHDATLQSLQLQCRPGWLVQYSGLATLLLHLSPAPICICQIPRSPPSPCHRRHADGFTYVSSKHIYLKAPSPAGWHNEPHCNQGYIALPHYYRHIWRLAGPLPSRLLQNTATDTWLPLSTRLQLTIILQQDMPLRAGSNQSKPSSPSTHH